MKNAKGIVVLASGSGSIAQALIDAGIVIHAIISDQPSAGVLRRAQTAGIPTHVVPLRHDRAAWNVELADVVSGYAPDLVVSAGFMRILGPVFLKRFEHQVINTHPALLPAFPGAHAVRDALAAGVTTTGVTVHWVDEGVDTGRVIAAREVPVLPGDTEPVLHERIKVTERELVVSVVLGLLS